MGIDRRAFVTGLAAVAVAGLAPALPALASLLSQKPYCCIGDDFRSNVHNKRCG